MLSPTEREILIYLLQVGNNAPGNIASGIERTPEYVSTRLRELEEEELVENLGSGVWALTPEGVAAARAYSREML